MTEWESLTENTRLELILVAGATFRVGDRFRLRPRPGGDVLNMALADKAAMIESIEQDFENRVHLAVMVDDDPGRDLGLLRQPGHRFFFAPEEVEPLGHEEHGG